MDDEDLNRLAAEELLKEAKRGEARAQVGGSMAWLPGTVPNTDKRFLANTLRHTLASNRVRERHVAGPYRRRPDGDSGRGDPPRHSSAWQGHGVRVQDRHERTESPERVGREERSGKTSERTEKSGARCGTEVNPRVKPAERRSKARTKNEKGVGDDAALNRSSKNAKLASR
ncbi:protein POLR1D-like [Amphibalanus amphitrite]|uniref:protein POLR1D-like n=1 Tax=Amphibalanus amphitrite TaxID=1232801 RepID=UPI001C916E79|nr:protein POLR1D-like [Amphibalanus amphitrite]XP_043210251.1 protein POLR1D-like [Amphibalanus amphitrite]